MDITGLIGKTSAQAMGMDFGADGNLYVLDYGGGFFTTTTKQSLWKITYTGGPSTPSAAPRAIPIGDFKVEFRKGGSGGVSYKWEFGDGATSTDANPTHTYAEAKRYTAKLTVTYADGSTDVGTIDVDVLAAKDEAAPTTTHTITPAAPSGDGTYKKPVTITLTAGDTGGSGVDRTEYRINDGAWTAYSAPVTRQQPGVYEFDFRSRDRAGNVEAIKTVTYTITVVQNCPTNLNDEFNGTSLDPKWTIAGNPPRSTPAALSVADGFLNLKIEAGDMIGQTNTARNVLLQTAPAGSWVISTKINTSELTNEGEQAGLILWQSERSGTPVTGQNNFAKIVYINKGITRRFEYVSTRANGQDIQNSPEFTENPTEVYMRVSSNGTNRIIAEGSFDGETWTQIANPITPSNSTAPMRFGLKVSDGTASSNRAMFDYFRVDCSDRVPPQTTATTDPGAPNGNLGWYKSAPTVTLKADEAATTKYRVDGGAWQDYGQPFPVGGEGNHTVEYQSVDKAEEPNTEAIKTLTLRSDSAAPETEVTLGGDMRAGGEVDVQLTAADGDLGSGSALTQYRVDGGPWKAYAAKDEQIFDGTAASLAQWQQAGPGRFDLMSNGSGGITPTGGLGMLWYPVKQFGDFRVKLQFREGRTDGGSSNGGVFLRFPDPRVPLAQRPDSCSKQGSAATDPAWVAIYCGHEFQMFDGIEPNSEPQKTGSVYNFQPNTIDKIGEAKPKGEWEDYEIEAVGQTFKIYRNGDLINTFVNSPGKASSRGGDPDTSQRQFTRGFIGLQNHGGVDTTQYRNVRVQDLTPGAATADPTGLFTVKGDGEHTVDYRSIDAAGNVEERKTVSFEIGDPVGAPPTPPATTATPTPTTTTPLPSPPTSSILPPMIDTPASYRLGRLPAAVSRSTFEPPWPLGPGDLHGRDDRFGHPDALEGRCQAAEAEPTDDRRR